MPRTIQLTNGLAISVVAMQEACNLLDCTLEDLSAWLANTWLREFCCECCEASWPLADDIFAVADLMQRYPQTELSELVQRHFERMQRSLQRKQPKGSAPRIHPNPRYDPAYQENQATEYVEPGRRYGARGRTQVPQSVQKQQQRTSLPFDEDATLEYVERDRRAPGRDRTLQGREQRRPFPNRTQHQFLPEEIDQFETVQHARDDRYQEPRRIEDYETVQGPYGRETEREVLDHRGRAKRILTHEIEVEIPEIESIPRHDPGRKLSPKAKSWWPRR